MEFNYDIVVVGAGHAGNDRFPDSGLGMAVGYADYTSTSKLAATLQGRYDAAPGGI